MEVGDNLPSRGVVLVGRKMSVSVLFLVVAYNVSWRE